LNLKDRIDVEATIVDAGESHYIYPIIFPLDFYNNHRFTTNERMRSYDI